MRLLSASTLTALRRVLLQAQRKQATFFLPDWTATGAWPAIASSELLRGLGDVARRVVARRERLAAEDLDREVPRRRDALDRELAERAKFDEELTPTPKVAA